MVGNTGAKSLMESLLKVCQRESEWDIPVKVCELSSLSNINWPTFVAFHHVVFTESPREK